MYRVQLVASGASGSGSEVSCVDVDYALGWGLEHRTLESIHAIGVDEIQYAKGHKYLTLVY